MHSISMAWHSFGFSWLKRSLMLGLCLGSIVVLKAQNNYTTPYHMTTLAGSTAPGSSDGTGIAARFNIPSGVAVDGVGNIYVVDSENHLVRHLNASGVVTTIKDSGQPTHFKRPGTIAVDAFGNVFVSDYEIHVIWKISPASKMSILAGAPVSQGGARDGPGVAALFRYPLGLAADAQGNVYVGDYLLILV